MTNQVTLQTLPDAIREDKYNKIATWILKYRRFSTVAASKHQPMVEGMSLGTLKQYFDGGIYYLNTGLKNGGVTTAVIKALDTLSSKVSPLTPANSEKRRVVRTLQQSKQFVPPVAKMSIVQQPTIARIKYGVMRDNGIVVFEREDVARAYRDGLMVAGLEGFKLVTIEVEDLK